MNPLNVILSRINLQHPPLSPKYIDFLYETKFRVLYIECFLEAKLFYNSVRPSAITLRRNVIFLAAIQARQLIVNIPYIIYLVCWSF